MPSGNKPYIWANVDPDQCRHMVLLGHNELKMTFIRFISSLTLLALWLKYSGKAISWQLMPWLLELPGISRQSILIYDIVKVFLDGNNMSNLCSFSLRLSNKTKFLGHLQIPVIWSSGSPFYIISWWCWCSKESHGSPCFCCRFCD